MRKESSEAALRDPFLISTVMPRRAAQPRFLPPAPASGAHILISALPCFFLTLLRAITRMFRRMGMLSCCMTSVDSDIIPNWAPRCTYEAKNEL
jgi:hypothetical protein